VRSDGRGAREICARPDRARFPQAAWPHRAHRAHRALLYPQKVQANRRRAAREAPHLSDDERGIYMAWSVSSDQRERMRSVDEPTAQEAVREARQLFGAITAMRVTLAAYPGMGPLAFLARTVQMPMLNTNPVVRLRAQEIVKLARGTSTAVSQRLLDATGSEAAEEAEQLAARVIEPS